MIECIIMVLVGALIGWFTNFLAIKLLFKPYNEIKILGVKFQGVIPRRKNALAVNLAKTIDEELLSIKDITATMNSLELEDEIDKISEKIVGDKLKKEIISKFPMAAMFLSDSLMEKIRGYIRNIIEENKEELVEIIVVKLEENIDLKQIVQGKIEEFPLPKLEKIVLEIAKAELKHIEVLGGILGAIIGMVQFLITKVVL
ncbi:MAG: hypothetical protein B6I28_01815 [Fusobacteriia bacterium 4572_132]|nr:MAG: hypothetical protein B6I28_01815 [Fusobacteriia bacterium 4572_132]